VPPHLQEAYKELNYKKGSFPLAEKMAETCLSLPLYPGLKNEQIEFVARKVKEFFSSKA
jgi:dTDP-4-amino-4,6-dideoxygalactose transaminase